MGHHFLILSVFPAPYNYPSTYLSPLTSFWFTSSLSATLALNAVYFLEVFNSKNMYLFVVLLFLHKNFISNILLLGSFNLFKK